jgi:hypothetical protein
MPEFRIGTIAVVAVTAAAIGCGNNKPDGSMTVRSVRVLPPPPPRCPAGAFLSKPGNTCQPRPSGPAAGARSSASFRLVRAPLVAIFPTAVPGFWVYYRLNRRLGRHEKVVVQLDDTTANTPIAGGRDLQTKHGYCYATHFDIPPSSMGPQLLNARAGDRVTLLIRDISKHGGAASIRLRVRSMLPREQEDAPDAGWFSALGCR